MAELSQADARKQAGFSPEEWCGRIVEVVGSQARTTFATAVVCQTQARGELVAWLELAPGSLFPPDLAAAGVALEGLVCLRLHSQQDMGKAADLLLRSGAFGLVVLDLPRAARLSDALLGRLLGLLRKHHATLVCLPAEGESAGLGSLVSLRFNAEYRSLGENNFELTVTVIKDKRHAPGRQWHWRCQGPAGLWLDAPTAAHRKLDLL